MNFDELVQKSVERYQDLPITLPDGSTFNMVNILRLEPEDRAIVQGLVFSKKDDDEGDADDEAATRQTIDEYEAVIRTSADNKEVAERFISLIDRDLTKLNVAVYEYLKRTQVGEA